MVMTPSQMPELGMQAPSFSLPDPTGKLHSFDDHPDATGYLVVFMCNHCPYVKHIRPALAAIGREYQPQGIAMFGINSNDFEQYPDDAPPEMAKDIRDFGYSFPYVYDRDQAVAKAFRAACTPDFFVFDRSKKLVYRGQFDDSRPGNGKPVTGNDLRRALDAVIHGKTIDPAQVPSIGCNIKWKRGNAPGWFG